jgi:hypothetical protein
MDKNFQDPRDRSISPRSGGFFADLTERFRLISRLMVDGRVNPFIKVLPIGALLYALWPMDVPGPFDDVFVIWLGTTLFVQLCPPDVVDEHTRALQGQNPAGPWQDYPSAQNQEVIDGEYYETDSRNPGRKSGR